MFDKTEKDLNKLGATFKEFPKPNNINEYVQRGISMGIMKKRTHRLKVLSNIAAVLILAALITSVRTIPVFAEYVSKIPGLEYIVNLINHDKGLKSAIENEFITNINESVTHENLTLTIKDIILDTSKGVIFYTIESSGDHRFINIDRVNLLNETGENLNASLTWGAFIDRDLLIEEQLDGMFEVNFNEKTILPDIIYLEVKLKEAMQSYGEAGYEEEVLSPTWKFELPVDHQKIINMEKTYSINKNIVVDGQKIYFKEMIITPTRASLKVEYAQDNTKNIFRFEDIKLVNEKGEVWGRIRNGVTGSKLAENQEILYFQSNYFSYPEELYITGSSIRGLDKSHSYVKIDIDNNELLSTPNDKLILSEILTDNSTVTLRFNLNVGQLDEKYHYSPFAPFIRDATGAQFEIVSTSSSSSNQGVQIQEVSFNKDGDIKGPIYLEVTDYPERITSAFKVKIR